jgi:hypothetical protein
MKELEEGVSFGEEERQSLLKMIEEERQRKKEELQSSQDYVLQLTTEKQQLLNRLSLYE